VAGDADRAGNDRVTLLVDDLADHVAALAGRGIATEAIYTMPGLYRRVVITDPEGNKITYGESLSGERE
jgi:predicted enzyme related to lactoylglutathione lyase